LRSFSVEDTVKMIGEGITRLIEKLVGERDTFNEG